MHFLIGGRSSSEPASGPASSISPVQCGVEGLRAGAGCLRPLRPGGFIVVPLKAGHDRTTTPIEDLLRHGRRPPLVACAAPGTDLAETTAECKAGIVVPACDDVALADGIVALLDGKAEGAWDPSTALEAARRHSPAAIAARYDDILCSLVPDSGGGSTRARDTAN